MIHSTKIHSTNRLDFGVAMVAAADNSLPNALALAGQTAASKAR